MWSYEFLLIAGGGAMFILAMCFGYHGVMSRFYDELYSAERRLLSQEQESV